MSLKATPRFLGEITAESAEHAEEIRLCHPAFGGTRGRVLVPCFCHGRCVSPVSAFICPENSRYAASGDSLAKPRRTQRSKPRAFLGS